MKRFKSILRFALAAQVVFLCMHAHAEECDTYTSPRACRGQNECEWARGGIDQPSACRRKPCKGLPSDCLQGCVVSSEEEDSTYVTQEDCTGHPDDCEWKQGVCRNKPSGTREVGEKKPPKASDVFGGPPRKASFRNLDFGGPPPPPGCYPPDPFPTFCNPKRNEPYVIDPPLDIPYCMRIPCSLDRSFQREYDEVHKACGSQPGCYFDAELFELREAFGPGVLPGVPVCHLAIRNAAFLREAQIAANALARGWNPFFTNCALQHVAQEMENESEGCKLIPLLEVFGIKPKMAGWGTITSRSCRLIDACWRPGRGCFYAVGSDVTVKSYQRFRYDRHEMVFGRPKCQGFDPRTPYSFVKSYHQCLASGCSVDTTTAVELYRKFFLIGRSMTVENHWKYWKFVEHGEIGPHNIDSIGWQYDKDFTGEGEDESDTGVFKPPIPPPRRQPDGIPFDLPGRRRRGIFPPPPPGGLSRRPVSKPKVKQCGEIFREYGGRPCPPPEVPGLNRYKVCPYIPFAVPRFRELKGSMEGCCDINLCYLSKRDIRKMHSGPAYYYSEWTSFTPCSVTCGGGGERYRYRKCIYHDKKACTEELMQTDSCGNNPCPFYKPWSRWTPCSYPNLCGIKERKRVCVPGKGKCEDQGPDEEVQQCGATC